MASLDELPPLPKSLSALMNDREQWKEMEKLHMMRTMIQQDMTHGSNRPVVPRGNLNGALAVLRREMVQLRQLDMSLLCQLWSLNESIQDYKTNYGDPMYDSMHSERSEPLYENTNGDVPLASTEEDASDSDDSDDEGVHREAVELNMASEASGDADSEDSDVTPTHSARHVGDDRRISSPTPSGGSARRSNWAFFGADMNGFSI
ncbi:PREDICTED: protein FAM89B-like [Priapulus caudatus]|uniref:Protein FAM89B-like n=1 Tax=Priapulus caudatus TaxID=37621 RepID=A0ABM1EZP9_PRICU|nr:PREDICTED: protein FAM89B-like [Priapulus caudatus]